MPTYEYECKSCSHTFEAFQSMREPPLKTCPQCGKEVRRLINGGSGIIFKGSGFYVTDKSHGSGSTAASPVKPDKSGEAAASSAATASTGTPAEASAGEKKEKNIAPEKALEKKAAG